MIKIGTVSTADPASGSVRVVFADRDDMVSAPLPVITAGGWGRGVAVPAPGETALCVFLDNGQSAGFCLGTYYAGDEHPPGNNNQRGTWFEDGSFVYYDRSAHVLQIKAASGVRIDGNLTVTGTIKNGG
ncbi:phage baseplate assembly protein V [Paenibacillus graminis]|uniref:phage baseplate assembly protein V n=1 Tax=Paenibacillus graminis TaxID=189425 RepID=UPI002DB6B10C|nr:phage baseplate assembly protein V [Paenibacillus graminis]MEC0171173.1 phage baseplate assembly protein V [Paenibacillus graminis]